MLDLLQKVKQYIEETEVNMDYEIGQARCLVDIIEDGDMPEVYDEILETMERIRENAKNKVKIRRKRKSS